MKGARARLAGLGRLLAQAVLPALVLYAAWTVTAGLVGEPAGPSGGGDGRERAETVYAVTAQEVALAENRASLRAFGEIVAAEIAELRVASPGEVIAIADDLAVGEIVEAGTALVTIDPFDYEGALREARAQLAEARARAEEARGRIAMETAALAGAEEQLAIAERDLERATDLRSGTIAPRAVDERRLAVSERGQSVERSRAMLDVEDARLAQQNAQIERLEWAVEKAERDLQNTVLRAPFTGIVRSESVAVGRRLAASDLAVTLVRADALDVRFVLSDARYGRLLSRGPLLGTPVTVTWAIGERPLTFDARIERVGADVASETGGVDVFARLAIDGGPTPRPGAFVEVSVPGPLHPASVRLPATALYGDHVFAIGPDERLVRRPVTLLDRDGEEVIVRGRLEAGEAVVTTRLAEAGAGLKVRRVELGDGPLATREPS